MNRHVLIIFSLLTSSNLCLSKTASRVMLKPSENGTALSLVDQATMSLKNGEVNEVNLKLPVLVNLESRIPVLLVPTSEGTSEVQLNPPTVRDATASAGQKEISLIVSEVYLGISEIQKDMQKKNLDRASAKVEELIKK